MNVLVTYATRHGGTAGIAERVSAALTAAGLSAVARPVDEVKDLKSSPSTRWCSAVRPTCCTGSSRP